MFLSIVGIIIFTSGLLILTNYIKQNRSSRKIEIIFLSIILMMTGSFLFGQKNRTLDQQKIVKSSSFSKSSSKKYSKESSKLAKKQQKKAIKNGSLAAEKSLKQSDEVNDESVNVHIGNKISGKEKLTSIAKDYAYKNNITDLKLDNKCTVHLSTSTTKSNSHLNKITNQIKAWSVQYNFKVDNITFYNSDKQIVRRNTETDTGQN